MQRGERQLVHLEGFVLLVRIQQIQLLWIEVFVAEVGLGEKPLR